MSDFDWSKLQSNIHRAHNQAQRGNTRAALYLYNVAENLRKRMRIYENVLERVADMDGDQMDWLKAAAQHALDQERMT